MKKVTRSDEAETEINCVRMYALGRAWQIEQNEKKFVQCKNNARIF